MFKEIIAVYPENHTKPTNTLCGQNAELVNVKACGTYSYHRSLKVKREQRKYSIRYNNKRKEETRKARNKGRNKRGKQRKDSTK
jgi:hypothetical protein